MIFAVSGASIGAGKSYFAKRLNPDYVLSLASPIREDLTKLYPYYPWFSKKQEDKNIVCCETGQTLRQMMVDYGQAKCKEDPLYFPKRLVDKIMSHPEANIAVDDLRKMRELVYFREVFGDSLVHFHIVHQSAVAEPLYDAEELMLNADYLVSR